MGTKIKNPEMMGKSGSNWNVVTGCNKYSDGCLNCFAEDVISWLQNMGKQKYANGFNLTCHYDRLDWPLQLAKKPKTPMRSFVTELGDLFHDKVPDEFISKVFDVLIQVPQHRFYFITKRAERLGQLGPHLPWKPWMWAGVTVESEKYLSRIDELRKLPKEVNKFVMMEPLLSAMPKLNLDDIDWLIVGGETNKKGKFRTMEKEWAINLRDQAKNAGLPFMFKHWSNKTHNSEPALLQGEMWNEIPSSLLKNINW
jgi:protein gp37